MANERLRGALTAAGLTPRDVAQRIGVDPRSVDRWIVLERLPHPGHRLDVAALLRTTVEYLWPEAFDSTQRKAASQAELITLYPNRGAVPRELWWQLMTNAQEQLDVLVFAGLFLPDGYPDLAQVLIDRGAAGAQVRFTLGDPECEAVALRGAEEGIGEGMAARTRLSLSYLDSAAGTTGVELRLHRTTLYNSLYRFDDDMLVNAHAYGAPAAQSIVMHLRKLPGGSLFDHFEQSFERVWKQAATFAG